MDLYQAALAYTARYATSKENLRRVLWRKLHRAALRNDQEPPETAVIEPEITAIIARLESIGAVDDQVYARAQFRTLQSRGTSFRAIRARLANKGVPAGIITALLASDTPEEDERTAATRYAKRRRLGPFRERETTPERRQKDLAALCRAGFSFSIASMVIDTRDDTPK